MGKDFLGVCKGVHLDKRGENDNHITVQILTEDDGNWFASEKGFSSYWIDDLINQLQKAKEFLEKQEPDIYDGRQYGWKFKK